MKITAFSTLRERIEPTFPCTLVQMASDRAGTLGEQIGYHLQQVAPQDPSQMNATLFSVLQHLSRARHQITIEIAEEDLEQLALWGRQSNSIFALPDQTLRDPDGALLVDALNSESSTNTNGVPVGTVPYPMDAVERQAKNRELLAQKKILITPDLPPIQGEGEVAGKVPDEVAWRALALFIVAVRAESIATNQIIPVDQLRAKSPMSFEALTPQEHAFMQDEAADPQTVVQFAWRYEALYALQWALGMHDSMSFPNDICDVPRIAETMVDQPDREIVVDAQLRPIDELLDATDLNYQLLWAARQAHLDGSDPPSGIDGGVLVERQHALNWILPIDESNWDEVDTPT